MIPDFQPFWIAFRKAKAWLLAAVVLIFANGTALGKSDRPVFEDIAARAGLTAAHISTTDKPIIMESMSGGAGFIDCDNDGLLDIVLVAGSNVDRYRHGGDPMVRLYRQVAPLKFEDITQQAGLTRKGWGMGVAVADFDNDGNLDLFVTGYGGNALYRNLGNCKFEDVTDKAGVRGSGFMTGAAWADYDRDGLVDIFVSRYVHVDMQRLPNFGTCTYKAIVVQCGPLGMEGETDLLFHNRGDGTFEEVAEKAGVSDPDRNYGLGVTWTDYDNDGWPDLYVANDSGPKYLYHNNHNGTFTDVAMKTGAALSGEGDTLGSMGVAFGDYDNDGRFDIFVTNFDLQPNTLYHAVPPDSFEDVSWNAGIAKPSFPMVKWGTSFFDYDNDGWRDLIVVGGHVYPQMETAPSGSRYRQPILLHHNNGDGTFKEVAAEAGLASLPLTSRRGVAFGDINNDGKIDVLILNLDGPPTLLLNTSSHENHSVLFSLIGTKSNHAAIGARVTLTAGKVTQMDEVRGGASYLSQNDLRLHFGLGKEVLMQSVEVRWPNGTVEKFQNLAADRIYTIREGEGIRETKSFEKH